MAGKKKVVKRTVKRFTDAGKAAKERHIKRSLAAKAAAGKKPTAAQSKKNALKYKKSPRGKAAAAKAEARAAATPTAKKTREATKSSKEKKSTEDSMKYLMDSGQRQYDPSSGMVMNKGGIVKKSNKKK